MVRLNGAHMIAGDWNDLTKFAVALAKASATEILSYFRQGIDVEAKEGPQWDPVTEADRAGERIMRQMIEERFPDHGIHGEEYGIKDGRAGITWILDPIDGTRSFVCGMPTWATLVGVMAEGQPIIGLMNQPFVCEMFYGNPEGAWHDYRGKKKPVRARRGVPLAKATIGTTAPELYRHTRDRAGFERLKATAQLTRYGGDAYFFALMAAGHIDIAMDAGLQPYDVAPLLPIISGSGGVFAEWAGGHAAAGGNIIAAGSEALLDEALAIMVGG